jgi:hypothetical protein
MPPNDYSLLDNLIPQQDHLEYMKKQSVHSVVKGDPIDPMLMQDNGNMLKSVYEKRINQGTIIQTRPGSQPSA